ncbi:MAG TPA: hypothetical protein VGR03_09695, partial [Candidatus Acidoferrum sp.]|nr:hypothetical protein [Candidatus Acidoferrum sp.]
MGKPSGRAEEQVDDDTLMPEPQARQRAPDFIPDAAPDFIPDGGGSPGATPYRPPGFEALKAQVATYPKEEPREGLLAGMSRRLIGTADPIHDVPAVLSDAIHHPLEGLENAPGRITAALGAPQQLAALRRVPSALKSGQYGEALGSALEGVIPIGGPMAAAIGEGLGSEHPEEGVRDAAALGYGALLGKAWPRVIDLAKDAAGAYSVPKPNALALGERFTPEQIRATAKEQAIPMTRAEISGSPIATAVQKQVERGLLSSHLADQHATAVKGSLGEWSNRLSDNLAPAATSEEAGGRIQTSLEGALAREKATAEANFKAVDGAAQGVTGSLAPAKQAVQQALDESSFIRNAVPALDAKRSTTVLQGMLATKEAPSPIAGQPPIRVPMLPDNASFSQMQQLRSALLDEARHPDNVLNEQGQGRIRLAIGAVDQAMAEAAKNLNPQALDLWRGANQHWADVHENFNNPRSPIYQILKSPDPNSAFQQLVPKSGGSPQVARQAMRYLGDDAGTLKREFVQRLIDPKGNGQPNFGGVEQRLNAYKEGYLNELFQPEELDELRKFARLSRSAGSLARMENPSNTA